MQGVLAARDPGDVYINNFMQAFSPNVLMLHKEDIPSTAKLYAYFERLEPQSHRPVEEPRPIDG